MISYLFARMLDGHTYIHTHTHTHTHTYTTDCHHNLWGYSTQLMNRTRVHADMMHCTNIGISRSLDNHTRVDMTFLTGNGRRKKIRKLSHQVAGDALLDYTPMSGNCRPVICMTLSWIGLLMIWTDVAHCCVSLVCVFLTFRNKPGNNYIVLGICIHSSFKTC